MRKAEEEAIRRARREIVRVRGVQEEGVLGGLIGGAEDVTPSAIVPVMDEDVDGSDGDEDMDDD